MAQPEITPASQQLPEPEADPLEAAQERRKRNFLRMRRVANILLASVTVVFILAEIGSVAYPGLDYVRAFAEAAMVGAIADWFAVTALFRHPFGLPIPHTAIIPKNKDSIGEGMAAFVENNFLTAESLDEKLKSFDLEKRMMDWLAVPANSAMLATRLANVLSSVLDKLDDKQVSAFIQENISLHFRGRNAAQTLADVLEVLLEQDRDQVVFEQVIHAIREALRKGEFDKNTIRTELNRNLDWYMRPFVNERNFDRFLKRAEDYLGEIERNRSHNFRKQFREMNHKLIRSLREDETTHTRIDNLIRELVDNPETNQFIENVFNSLRERLIHTLADADAPLRKQLQRNLYQFFNNLIQDQAMRQRIVHGVYATLINTASSYRHEIASLITTGFKRWDERTIADKLEVQVGKDLQYIRINGTLVGGMVGLLIHVVAELLT